MKIYVDIDETICDYDPPTERIYSKAKPIKINIDKINKLYEQGNEITYYTARGSTFTNRIEEFIKLTKIQLQDWGCKYHHLSVGEKPVYDLIICDKSRRIEEI